MRKGGNVELYPAWDEARDQLIYWSGDWQNTAGVGGPKAFQWLDEAGNIVPDAKPALTTPDGKGREIEGKTYRTSWDLLVEHVTPWTVERAAEFCELPADKIREAIGYYLDASPHACFTRGQKVEFFINTSGISQAFTIMMALAGNFDTKGGQNIGRKPILSIEGGKEIIEGFKNLDFFVNVDIFMTPSGELADIILPAAHPNEVDRVEWAHSGHGYPTSHTYLIRQPFHAPLGEAKDDMDICFEFAEYMGVDMYWKDKYEFFDYMVRGPETLPAELSCSSFEEFRERISVTGVEMTAVRNAPKYETGFMRKTSDFRPGFNTMYRGNKMGSVYRFPGAELPDGTVIPPHPQSDNGKMELWSEDLLLYGNGPLPMYIEPPITKKSREDLTGEHPFTLITGGRSHAFFHTEYRNSPWMREVHMFPTMDINPATAAELGIKQDDWCWIETYVDRIRQRANLTEAIKPDTIHVEHDWWFPERAATDDLHGALDANCNILFENNGPYDPAVGTDNFGGLCKVYKAEEGAPDNICMTSEDCASSCP